MKSKFLEELQPYSVADLGLRNGDCVNRLMIDISIESSTKETPERKSSFGLESRYVSCCHFQYFLHLVTVVVDEEKSVLHIVLQGEETKTEQWAIQEG